MHSLQLGGSVYVSIRFELLVPGIIYRDLAFFG